MNTYGARPLQVLQRASGASEHAGGAVPSDGGKRARKRLGGLGSMRTGVTAPRDELTRVRQLSELGFTYQQRKKPVTSFPSTLGVTPLHESRGKTEELLPSPAAREGWRRCRERWAHRKKNARSGKKETTKTTKFGFRRKSEQARPLAGLDRPSGQTLKSPGRAH